jgi:hypothetical protein
MLVYLFGAYAYGAATVYGMREMSPIWGESTAAYAPGVRRRIDRVGLALFAISTVWFVLHLLLEFRNFTGATREGWLDLVQFMVFAFPPVIMHTVYLESQCEGEPPPPAIYRLLLIGMYLLGPAMALWATAAVFDLAWYPQPFGMFLGVSIGGMFTLTGIYATVLMLRRPPLPRTGHHQPVRNVMIAGFAGLTLIFIILLSLRERQLLGMILERVSKSAPLYFMIAAIYYESRFAFYDLIIKRAVLILMSVIVLGVSLALMLPLLDALPGGLARPWLFAIALAPVAMVMPWLVAKSERWLDRKWLRREFTPVEAVKHVLAAMQPATDEKSLIAAAEARLSEIFGAKIAVLVGSAAVFTDPVDVDIKLESPVSGAIVRIAVIKEEQGRRFLSEDLTLLRSLGGVFGFMLENIKLQRKRVEQEQLAQELRLQTSKSELKALRAQINPHFLFNALNAIASLIHTDPARADEAVEQLAEVFRYTLRRSDSEWAPLDQELIFARAYLDVEQARFGQRLTCTIDSDHRMPAPSVPSMLLQTLLENAVKHGVSQERGPGRIEVMVRTTAEQVAIEVRNTGPGGDALGLPSRQGEGFGLHSVRERLKGHFGDRASFTLTRDEAARVTIARITLPNVRMAA